MHQMKCGRKIFDLRDGDQIMDNGSCLQLITRTVGCGFNRASPRVSKSEFNKFKNLLGVIVSEHNGYKLYTLASQPIISD